MPATSIRHSARPHPGRPARRPTGPPTLEPRDRQALLACARAALAVATGLRPPSALGEALEAAGGLDRPARAFVTLTENGRLRGCVGSLDPDRSIPDSVVTAAIRAALDDPRFAPLQAAELPAVQVGVSVLGPSRSLRSIGAFRPGIDGVIVERDRRAALLLPEVADELEATASGMLDAACRKAGLPARAWIEPGTRIRTFETVRFEGPALGDDGPTSAQGEVP